MTEIATSDTIVFFCSFFCICIYGLVFVFCAYKFLTKDIKVLSVKIAENVALWTLRKKKKRRRKYDCNTLSGKHVFDLHSAWKDILRWNLSYKRLIRSSLATLLWEAFHCICLVLNPYTDLYIPSHLSSGTGSCMYFKKGQVTVYMMLVYFLRCERLKCS